MSLLVLLLACASETPPEGKPPPCSPVDEQCNGADDDCDGAVDEDVAGAPTWYPDADADGWGDDAGGSTGCTAPAGHVEVPGDCDDADPDSNPGGFEACGGGDEDCDGAVDEEGAAGEAPLYADLDADGFGDAATAVRTCPAEGWVTDATDCDDVLAGVNPGAPEVCDGLDQDCDGAIDEDPGCVPDPCDTLVATENDMGFEGVIAEEAMTVFCERFNAVTGNLTIDATGLTDLSALDCLCEVGGYVRIASNGSLTSLAGLENLRSVGGVLSLQVNGSLTSLDGLSSLTTIGGLYVGTNDALTDLRGLPPVTTLDTLTIRGGASLTSLAGLESVETVGDLTIEEVALADLAGLEGLVRVDGDLTLSASPSLTDLSALGGVEEVGGTLDIADLPVTSLDGFAALVTLGGLRLAGNDALADIGALYRVTELTESLDIEDGLSLYDLGGLDALTTVGGDVAILDTEEGQSPLESLEALSALRSVGRNLVVGYYPNLVDLRGLENVAGAGGYLNVLYLDGLTTLDGLEGFRSTGTRLVVRGNPVLVDVRALHGVTSVGSDLVVTDNPSLASADAQALVEAIGEPAVGGSVTVEDNGP